MIIVACPYLQTVQASITYHIPGESTPSPEHAGALPASPAPVSRAKKCRPSNRPRLDNRQNGPRQEDHRSHLGSDGSEQQPRLEVVRCLR